MILNRVHQLHVQLSLSLSVYPCRCSISPFPDEYYLGCLSFLFQLSSHIGTSKTLALDLEIGKIAEDCLGFAVKHHINLRLAPNAAPLVSNSFDTSPTSGFPVIPLKASEPPPCSASTTVDQRLFTLYH